VERFKVRDQFAKKPMYSRVAWLATAITLFVPQCASAWFDPAWPFRREVELAWEAEKASGSELALAEIYTAGHHKEDGSDIRVAADDGRVVASRVLGIGPGDFVRLVFNPSKGQRKYHVYFGNENPPPKPKGTEDVVYHAGLLMEMRAFPGGPVNNATQIIDAFDRAKTPIGTTMIPSLFIGRNPFGEQQQWVTRFTGIVYAPLLGEYTFAISADDRGLLMLDGHPLVFAPNNTGDVRYQAKITLNHGLHDVTAYHVNLGNEGQLSVGWLRPDTAKFDVIGKGFFGMLYRTTTGPLEEIHKTLTADFNVEYMGEALYAGHYSNRYRFIVNAPKTQPPVYTWDLGDGQTAEGNTVDHVYLTDGVYPIRLTARIGANADAQTTKFAAHRDYDAEKTRIDEPAVQSKVIETFKLDKIPAAQLPWAVLLHQRSLKIDLALAATMRMAATPAGYDRAAGLEALRDATRDALAANRVETILKIWDSIPPDSTMQPEASKDYAQLLVWQAADFDKACKILAPQAKSRDSAVQRLYGQALVLNQKSEEGRKLLESLAPEGPLGKQAAISGAMARTVEYYITKEDAETGEEWWDKWQRQYPAEFLEGYGVLLRVKLMEVRKAPQAAAKVAEAFALAVPHSSYAPSLLDYARRLLAQSNPDKSAELRKLLKQKYPEDPLSQDKK
jgi:hypothetical protein